VRPVCLSAPLVAYMRVLGLESTVHVAPHCACTRTLRFRHCTRTVRLGSAVALYVPLVPPVLSFFLAGLVRVSTVVRRHSTVVASLPRPGVIWGSPRRVSS